MATLTAVSLCTATAKGEVSGWAHLVELDGAKGYSYSEGFCLRLSKNRTLSFLAGLFEISMNGRGLIFVDAHFTLPNEPMPSVFPRT